jgi:hypothetical protein
VRSILVVLILPAFAERGQEDSTYGEIVALADRFLAKARTSFEKQEWFDAMEQAERARTAYMTLAELYDSQKRTADRQKAGDAVQQCNQLIKLANDARKAAGPAPPAPKDPGKPEDPLPVPAPLAPRPVEKLPVPPAVAQSEAERTIRETYKAEYAKRGSQDLNGLAKKLLSQAQDSANHPTTRFVLLREAREAAIQAGDSRLALVAIDEAARVFMLDAVPLKVAAVSRIASSAKGTAGWEAAELCLAVADEAALQESYDLGTILVKRAQALAGAPRNPSLISLAQGRSKDLQELPKERDRAVAAEKSLHTTPDDPNSCAVLGRYLALVKGDWDRGLPLLAKGSDVRLKTLAERDLSAPSKPDFQAEMGHEWWTASEAEASPRARSRMRTRAKAWYDRALPSLGGLLSVKAKKRSEEVEDETAWLWSVNLLKIIDTRRDGVSGDWRCDGESLTTPVVAKAGAWLQIPYSPSEEYDLRIVAARKSGALDFFVGFVGGGKQLLAHIDGGNGEVGGLQTIDNKDWAFNETSYKGRIFFDDKPKTLVFSVRKSGITFTADGKTWINWKGDYRRVTPTKIVPDPSALFLGDLESVFEVSQLVLLPFSGQGRRIRPSQ